jgi:hypothetical protein
MPCPGDFALVRGARIADAAIVKVSPFCFDRQHATGGLILDAKGQCVTASRELAARLGTTPDQMRGDGWKRHLSEGSMRAIQTSWAAGMSLIECAFLRFVRLCAIGDAPGALIKFRPIYRLDLSIGGYLGIAKTAALAASREDAAEAG